MQTVRTRRNPLYYALISAFERSPAARYRQHSFNVRGEPIVCTPEDAYRCFMRTEMDLLALGNFLLQKAEQDALLRRRYEDAFALD